MENGVDEKGKENLGQESVETALLSLVLQRQNSSVCALTSFLICRSTDEWLQLQVSLPQGQEFRVGWGMAYRQRAPCQLFLTFAQKMP